tara:strand:- start:36 stop:644 length:609 start_codon:yes stop_codon:yes gene_type:complete
MARLLSNDEASFRSRSLFLGAVLAEEPELVLGDQRQSGGASEGLEANVLSKLGGVSLETLTLAGSTNLDGTEADNTGVNTAGNAVLLLDVNLGDVEVLDVKGKVVLNISLGGAIDKVAHLESLDGLVLGAALGAVKATNSVGVTLVALVPSVVSSFDWHNLIIIDYQDTPFLLTPCICNHLVLFTNQAYCNAYLSFLIFKIS